MFRRVLIANRGEIAVRIARTCRRLGVGTVAVFSDADARALHVTCTDLARRIGPADPARSYLDTTAVIAAAHATGADALHPGYGFLSENADFAEQCASAGLVFVGPRPAAIRAMGSKANARALAAERGVPIVPGGPALPRDDAAVAREAARIGYPILVKASAGGGGKGMRVVETPDALPAAVSAARQEAIAAFGDGTLLLERFLASARHVEVQVIGDRHGHRTHLFDRDCSVQRNHQKIVEEAPAPGLPDSLRSAMYDAALRLAGAIEYDSLGTVEFLVVPETGEFYFLEMNTRLQVEHPTTELVTGLDLVELQLRVAAGEPLPDAVLHANRCGAAIEARVCAERPEHGFAPATGEIHSLTVPTIEGVRVDTGVTVENVVTAHYDSMLAKVIAHGRDREEARFRLTAALAGATLAGIEHNVDFLREILETPSFRTGRVSTRLLEEEFPGGYAPGHADDHLDRIAAAVAWIGAIERARRDRLPPPWDRLGPWRLAHRAGHPGWTSLLLRDADGALTALRLTGVDGRYEVDIAGQVRHVEAWYPTAGVLQLELDGTVHRRVVELAGSHVWMAGGQRHRHWAIVSREAQAAAREGGAVGDARDIVAPFPGIVSGVAVAAGERVEEGTVLIVMEAMKMVHALRASGAGVVGRIHCRVGQTVAAGDLLIEIGEVAA